jgi:hypothetical protein
MLHGQTMDNATPPLNHARAAHNQYSTLHMIGLPGLVLFPKRCCPDRDLRQLGPHVTHTVHTDTPHNHTTLRSFDGFLFGELRYC